MTRKTVLRTVAVAGVIAVIVGGVISAGRGPNFSPDGRGPNIITTR